MNNDFASKNMLGSSLPPHLSGASPITYFCGNMVWQNLLGVGQKVLEKKEESFTILDGKYDELHQVAFAPEQQTKMVLENTDYEDLNVRDENGNTPLLWACFNQNEQMVQLLIDQGAAVNMQNYVGETALYIAAARGLDRICTLLLISGANTRFSNLEGATALHIAAANGNIGVLRILIAHGAFLNAQDEEGDTPLHYAIREGQRESVEILVSFGADFGIKNEDQESSFDLAVEFGESEIVSILSKMGPKPTNIENPSEHHLYFGEDAEMQISKKEHQQVQMQNYIRTSVTFC